MKAKTSILLTALASAAFTLAAQAVDTSTPALTDFDGMDANHDGSVTSGEHADAAKKIFDLLDDNGDGSVTLAEMEVAHKKITGHAYGEDPGGMTAAARIGYFDINADGVLSASEYATGADHVFQDMDLDHDGALTRQEYDAGHAGHAWIGG